jgi:hypothetical protein
MLQPGIEKPNRCQKPNRTDLTEIVNIDKTTQKPVQILIFENLGKK